MIILIVGSMERFGIHVADDNTLLFFPICVLMTVARFAGLFDALACDMKDATPNRGDSMRLRLSIRAACLAGLALGACGLTSGIMARYASAKSSAKENSGARELTTKVVRLKGEAGALPPLPAGEVPRPVRKAASWSLRSHSIEVVGREVRVSASVALMDRRPIPNLYLWRLRAFQGEDGPLVLDRPYKGQMFEIDPSGEMNPTFAESIELPPGRYHIRLNLYGVPKGYDLAELNDNDRTWASSLIHVPKLVEIR